MAEDRLFGFLGLCSCCSGWVLLRTDSDEGPGASLLQGAWLVSRPPVYSRTLPSLCWVPTTKGSQRSSQVSRYMPLPFQQVYMGPSAQGQGRVWSTGPHRVQAPVNQVPRPTGSGRTVRRSCPPSTARTELCTGTHKGTSHLSGRQLKDVSR